MCVRRSSCLSCSSFAQFHPLSFSLTHSLSHPLTHSLTLTSIFHLQLLDKDDIQDQDGASMDSDSERKGKAVVIKTSTRQVCCASYFTSILVFEKKKEKIFVNCVASKRRGGGTKDFVCHGDKLTLLSLLLCLAPLCRLCSSQTRASSPLLA